MKTWIDTNVLVAIWSGNAAAQALAKIFLEDEAYGGQVAISGCVYAEFLAGPDRRYEDIATFLAEAEITVVWQTGEEVWRLAADRFAGYAERRRAQTKAPKQFLADFLIGAQAVVDGGRLITFDKRLYRAAFPELALLGSTLRPN